MGTNYNTIYEEVISTLSEKLPSHLKYHCVDHTRYVVKMTQYIADKEKISKKDTKLLKIAALFHDIGFIISPEDHEKKSCAIAKIELKKYGFDKRDIDKICGMIMATRIPQSPKTDLENILADADLEYLSTSTFRQVSEQLYEELRYFNREIDRKKWFDIQVNFISNHRYHTNYCKRYKEFRKMRNLEKLTQTFEF